MDAIEHSEANAVTRLACEFGHAFDIDTSIVDEEIVGSIQPCPVVMSMPGVEQSCEGTIVWARRLDDDHVPEVDDGA